MAVAVAGAEIMVKVGASNYQIFICVDPDPYLDYGSTKLLKRILFGSGSATLV